MTTPALAKLKTLMGSGSAAAPAPASRPRLRDEGGPASRAHANAPLSAPGSTSFDPGAFEVPAMPVGVEVFAMLPPWPLPADEVLVRLAPDDFAWQTVMAFTRIRERNSGNVVSTILPRDAGEIVITIQRYPRAFAKRRGLEPLVDVGRVRITTRPGQVVVPADVALDVRRDVPPNIRDALLRALSSVLDRHRPRSLDDDLSPLAQTLLDALVREAQRTADGVANVGRVVEHVRPQVGNKTTEDIHAALRELDAAGAIQLRTHTMDPVRWIERQLSPTDSEGRELVTARVRLPYKAEGGDPIVGYHIVMTMVVDHPERRGSTLPKVEAGHRYDFYDFTKNRAYAEQSFDQLMAGRATSTGLSPDGSSEYAGEIGVSVVTTRHRWAGWIRGPEARARPEGSDR